MAATKSITGIEANDLLLLKSMKKLYDFFNENIANTIIITELKQLFDHNVKIYSIKSSSSSIFVLEICAHHSIDVSVPHHLLQDLVVVWGHGHHGVLHSGRMHF